MTMIVIDTSAIVAIAFAEPERETFVQVLQRADRVLISSVSVVEARMVVHGRRGQRAVVLVDDLLRLPMFDVVPPGPAEDSGHAAALDFGDLFSYATAKVRHLPLLYKGTDFSETDIASALPLARDEGERPG